MSPQPEPPAAPEIDTGRIKVQTADAGLLLVGAPGAVSLPGELRGVDLDDGSPASTTKVAADGSFSIPFTGARTDWFRLQAIASGVRSRPVDVTGATGIMPGETVVPVPPTLGDCLRITGGATADEIGPIASGRATTVTIDNGCSADATIASTSLRFASTAFTLTLPTPLVVPRGGQRTFTVAYARSAGAPDEDVLVLQISAPLAGRRALTLVGAP